MSDTLLIEWVDPTGKVWDLTNGTQGVVLDTGLKGLGWSGIKHATARSGQRIMSSTLERATHTLAVSLDPARVGMAAYELRERWWFVANSFSDYGTLRVTRPDGEVRTRRLKLAAAPDTEYGHDPGLGIDDTVEVWELTGNGPWWQGGAQERVITYADLTAGNDTPFYGPAGMAPPFYISKPYSAQGVTMDNTGQGNMWVTWELTGPMTDPSFGFGRAGTLQFNGIIPAGEKVTIVTDPENRVVLDNNGISAFRYVSGAWVPTPRGMQVPISFTAQAIGTNTRAIATGVEQYAAPF